MLIAGRRSGTTTAVAIPGGSAWRPSTWRPPKPATGRQPGRGDRERFLGAALDQVEPAAGLRLPDQEQAGERAAFAQHIRLLRRVLLGARHPAALRITEAELECDHLAGDGIADQRGQRMLAPRAARDVGLEVAQLILVGLDRLGRDAPLLEVEPGRATGRDRDQPVE